MASRGLNDRRRRIEKDVAHTHTFNPGQKLPFFSVWNLPQIPTAGYVGLEPTKTNRLLEY